MPILATLWTDRHAQMRTNWAETLSLPTLFIGVIWACNQIFLLQISHYKLTQQANKCFSLWHQVLILLLLPAYIFIAWTIAKWSNCQHIRNNGIRILNLYNRVSWSTRPGQKLCCPWKLSLRSAAAYWISKQLTLWTIKQSASLLLTYI